METNRKISQKTISRSFLTGLTGIVLISFIASIGLSWILQTRLSNRSAEELLRINIEDVQQDILDKSDQNLLQLTHAIADELPEEAESSSERLAELLRRYDVAEINVIDQDGILYPWLP